MSGELSPSPRPVPAGRLVALAGLLLALAGCHNACQDLCKTMADYATECGHPVTDADLDACYARQSNPEHDDAKACRDFGDPASVRNQWSCDEIALYFGGGAET